MGYTIVTLDEAGLNLTPVYTTTWCIKGEKIRAPFFWTTKKLKIFGALINGKELYYEWNIASNTFTFYEFLSNLFDYCKGKIVLVMDNAGYHKTYPIMGLIERYKDRVAVEFIPPYSPELNPTETCWKIIKHNTINNNYYRTLEEMQYAVEDYLSKNKFMLNPSNYLCP